MAVCSAPAPFSFHKFGWKNYSQIVVSGQGLDSSWTQFNWWCIMSHDKKMVFLHRMIAVSFRSYILLSCTNFSKFKNLSLFSVICVSPTLSYVTFRIIFYIGTTSKKKESIFIYKRVGIIIITVCHVSCIHIAMHISSKTIKKNEIKTHTPMTMMSYRVDDIQWCECEHLCSVYTYRLHL